MIFLTIDHINWNGESERKVNYLALKGVVFFWRMIIKKPGGAKFYRWLKQQGYPTDNYQVLCFNCNFAKHVLGTCPHRAEPESSYSL